MLVEMYHLKLPRLPYSKRQPFYSSSEMDPTLPAATTIISGLCSHHVAHISLFSSSKKKKYNKLKEKQRGRGPERPGVFWFYFEEIRISVNAVFVKCPT